MCAEDCFWPLGAWNFALAGHILRTNDSDPLRQTTYAPSTACKYPTGKRRVGGPRQQWWHFPHKYIWENLSDERTESENTNRQNHKYHQLALARNFWIQSHRGPTDTWMPSAAKKNQTQKPWLSLIIYHGWGMWLLLLFSMRCKSVHQCTSSISLRGLAIVVIFRGRCVQHSGTPADDGRMRVLSN